jgi:4-aminobutyrate--pyruvate transaminase
MVTVGAAVALENIKIIEERDLVTNAAERGAELQAGLANFADHPLVGEARGVGLIAALELIAPAGRESEFAAGKLGAQMNAIMLENGLMSRNMLDAVAFCPPLIVTSEQVTEMMNIVHRSLKTLTSEI